MSKPRIAVFSGPRAHHRQHTPARHEQQGAGGGGTAAGRSVRPPRPAVPPRAGAGAYRKIQRAPAGIRRHRGLPRRRETVSRGGAAAGGTVRIRCPTWRAAPTAPGDGTPFGGRRPARREHRLRRETIVLPRCLAAVRRDRPRAGAGAATTARRASWTGLRSSTSCACSRPSGFTKQGEVGGRDFFPYSPRPLGKFPAPCGHGPRGQTSSSRPSTRGATTGFIWLEGSPHVEETLYWLSLVLDTDPALRGHLVAASPRDPRQRRRTATSWTPRAISLPGSARGWGAVGIVDEQIFAARVFKKGRRTAGRLPRHGGSRRRAARQRVRGKCACGTVPRTGPRARPRLR